MRIDSQIAALPRDPAEQRRGQNAINEAVQRWKADPALTPVLQQFSRYANGDALEALSELHALLRSKEAADRFVESWLNVHLAALRESPLSQLPFRHSYNSGFATMQLLVEREASLALVVYEERSDPIEPESAIFSDREQHEIAVAGQAQGIFSCLNHAGDLSNIVRRVGPGDVFSFDCNREVRQWTEVEGRLVLLQLSRTAQQPKPSRELNLKDGSLLMQSDGDKLTSQSSMALAVLGALGRKDAVPVMGKLASNGPAHLRWEAVRQMLALDPFGGIDALDRMAADPADELAAPARNLAAQLRDQYPGLRAEEAA